MPNDATNSGLEDGVLGHTVSIVVGEAASATAVVVDSAAAFGAVAHDDENEGQAAVADTAVSLLCSVDMAGETVVAAHSLADTVGDGEDIAAGEVTAEGGVRATPGRTVLVADEVVANEGEGVIDGDGEPIAAGDVNAHGGVTSATYSVASAADEIVAAQGEAVTMDEDVGGRATNLDASAARSDENTMVNVGLLAARSNPEEPSREQIGDSDVITIDISPQEELSEEISPATATPSTEQFSGGCPVIIAKVGDLTRNVNEMEYEPHHVSIGPYHRIDHPHLAKDGEKERCLADVLSMKPGATEQKYLEALAFLEKQARRCYDDEFSIESKEFMRMLLLDGCYLLRRFGNLDAGPHRNGTQEASGHHVQRESSSSTVLASGGANKLEGVSVVRDCLFLAENQIPFFVLEKIYHLTFDGRDTSAADRIALYVRQLLAETYQYYHVVEAPPLANPSKPGNLLHLLHMHFKPSSMLSSGTSNNKSVPIGERVGRWRSATDYHMVGVKFKWRLVGAGDAKCILDVELTGRGGGVLEIPRLNIHGETRRLLRNLMALEQQNPVVGSHVTAFCVFMSQVASKESDVELLCSEGIIHHSIGNNAEVASLFSDLCKGIVFDPNSADDNYLLPYWQKLEKRYQSLLPRWTAWFKHTYFRNPCLAIGLLAVTVGLFCAIVQTVYSVLAYYYRHS
ncbi:hypothetical protein BAE44_0025118 [Dichanthelium oligosanthes]|uniref:Uncharacterized protein n=1 Tax=Dichanthelium oligosanthes TaxID=888268 RepID=A0A1E5ULV9_9POAL|nr:hypothetical protein BAE44_0025118 [Dichanthelium oligosanthes]